MKTLRVLSVLLLLASPALASAADPRCVDAACKLFITDGAFTIRDGDRADWSGSGQGFTASGGWSGEIDFPAGSTFNPAGFPVSIFWGENCVGFFSMSVTFNNGTTVATGDPIPNGDPNGRCGLGTFTGKTTVPITGAGVFPAEISFHGSLDPDGCLITCNPLFVSGQGTGTMTFSFDQVVGNTDLFRMTSATFTLSAPEPSTVPLFLIGFAGLGLLALRRRLKHEAWNRA